MNRTQNLEQLDNQKTWDIAIIGGGSSGLGVALDALSRGLSVVLLERADFATGTSSRSTKLVHGGVRYLAQGDLFLVWEALRERGRILSNAPHLANTQPFIIPIYSHSTKYFYTVGLKFYDWMSGWLSLGDSYFIPKKEAVARLPQIQSKGLLGGVVYHDGGFDDARLALSIAQTCDDMGGAILNYTKVTSLTKDESGKVSGLKVRDLINRKNYEIKAKMVVNATGVFADKILKMDKEDSPRMIQPSQGVHIVLPKEFLGGSDALMIPKTSDGRVLFAVPWKDKLVVGTTDTIREKAKMEPEALAREVNFILNTAGLYLSKKPTREDVLSVYAGLRPLAAPSKGSVKTKEISRNHKVILSDTGLVTLTGGKWTTFRKMGEDTVDHFPRLTGEKIPDSKSWELKLHGYDLAMLDDPHWKKYGSDAVKILTMIKKNHELARLLHPNYPFTAGEVVWAVREEMALKVEDVLSRRMRILLMDARASIEMAPKVAELMAKELEYDQEWIDKEIAEFTNLANKYILKTH
ncbi:glycerol-3-phosphate dehydrogenase [Echinicola pacifica]|uniref:Glycerol-3-phosphate dehydrogenase n=1 Tax=Echinicola pacifica TaxID=346377 RepID=A0A918Q5N9_9BACT|nr:glycerol-3-phosphate dehydrogenase/oxidase [Echinicola pacifica]GGZ34067.1 glycerol-3-phosphate dehydrogenase [Echinicola pacifica]